MPEFKLNEAWENMQRIVGEMSLVRKAAILVGLFVSFSVIGLVYELSNKATYEVLFSSLKTDDIGQIAAALDKYKVPYQIQSESQSILVPGEKVLETRLKLAKDGLPKFGGVGFEIFDQKSFGMTEFEQRLNYQRALQGELARTIDGIEEVEDARVHLVIPEQTIFARSRELPSASVVLKLASGRRLAEASVESIVHLVSSSVPNLDAKDVTVVDTAGQLLTAQSGDENSDRSRRKVDLEKNYEDKVRTLLEPIVGMGKVKVRVTADLDFTSREMTEEKYDPDSIAVRSEKKTKISEASATGSAGGVVGANAQKNESSPTKDHNEQNESVDYEVSKQVSRTVGATGELRKLSVAVVVDGLTSVGADGKTAYAARGTDEIKNYEDLVKSAVGFQTERGDQVKVMNLAFQNLEQMFTPQPETFWTRIAGERSGFSFALGVLSEIVLALIAVLLLVFVVRPMAVAFMERRRAAAQGEAEEAQSKLPPQAQALLQDAKIKQEIRKQAVEDPDNMVNVLRNWMST